MIKKHKTIIAYMLVLAVFTTYVVLDTFVITRVYSESSGSGVESSLQADDSTTAGESENNGQNNVQSEENGSETGDGERSHGPGGPHGSGDGNGGPPSGGPGHSHGKSSGSSSGSSSGNGSGSSSGSSGTTASTGNTVSAAVTQDTYSDGKISVQLDEYTVNDTTVYVAEVTAASADYLKTAFAQDAYGKNVTEATSDIAEGVDAILAINGDYYGAQEKGYVIRNGKLYRDTASAGSEDLVIYKDGSFGIINESEVTAQQLISDGAVQTLSFGPALVENGQVSVDSDDEVGRAMASNPRTAIGIKADGTYLFVVSDGRTDESEGLSLLELAEFMKDQGAVTAYNLDGGGSSTMVFNGTVVNTPTGGGVGNGSGSERKVSDIVYIGY